VRLPRVVVTRLTATARPLPERVRRWGKARTLRRFPSRAAGTRRICTRRTCRWARRPLSWCPCHRGRRLAPAVATAPLPTHAWSCLARRCSRAHRPSGSLHACASDEVARQPSLRRAIPSCSLTEPPSLAPLAHTCTPCGGPHGPLSLLAGRATGLPRSTCVPVWERSRLFAGAPPSALGA
jgi:hypothetical protein